MDDLIKSLKANLHDRATSPLSGAFLLSWVVCNWEILLVVISDSYIYDKISHLKNLIDQAGWLYLFIYPVLGAIFFVGLYPFVARKFYEASRWHQNKLKNARIKYDGEQPISQDEAKELMIGISQLRKRYEDIISELTSQIEKLEEKNTKLEVKSIMSVNLENENAMSPQIPLADVNSIIGSAILSFVKRNPDCRRRDYLAKADFGNSDKDRLYQNSIIDRFVKENLISENSGKLQITENGEKFIQELANRSKPV